MLAIVSSVLLDMLGRAAESESVLLAEVGVAKIMPTPTPDTGQIQA